MLLWLMENYITVIICAVLALAVAAVIVSAIRNKKKGKSACSCGSGCTGCPFSAKCHEK